MNGNDLLHRQAYIYEVLSAVRELLNRPMGISFWKYGSGLCLQSQAITYYEVPWGSPESWRLLD